MATRAKTIVRTKAEGKKLRDSVSSSGRSFKIDLPAEEKLASKGAASEPKPVKSARAVVAACGEALSVAEPEPEKKFLVNLVGSFRGILL